MNTYIKHIISAVSLTLIMACSATPKVEKNEFLIEAEVSNLPEGAVMALYYGGKTLTDTIQNGRFQFRDTISVDTKKEINTALIARNSYNVGMSPAYREVWVSPGSYTKISGDGIYYANWKFESKSKLQRSSEKFYAAMKKEGLLHEYLMVKRNSGEIYSGEESYNVERQMDTMRKHMTLRSIEYLTSAKVDEYWLSRVNMLAKGLSYSDDETRGFTRDDVVKLSQRIPKSLADDEVTLMIEEYLKELPTVGVGDKMVDGELVDLEGNKHTLSEFSGSYILLDFWSAGCGPCISAMPEIKEVSELYKDRLNVVSIYVSSEKSLRDYASKSELHGNQWIDSYVPSRLMRIYKVKGIPNFVLISPEGVIVETWSGYSNGSLKSKLKGLLD